LIIEVFRTLRERGNRIVPENFKRKLTAILSADAVGYSRLMAEDEAATVRTLASYREIMASLIKQHRGRIVDSPGDNLLAEFSSVVDAVQCAVAVQSEIQTRNAEMAENRRMEFRIGINLGDVIDEKNRIYGDGVNVAARLEALADPGGVCVSKTAFDQIETKLPLGYEYLGQQSVKNIPKPVGAYRVLMKPDAVGKVIGEKRFLGRISRRTAMVAIIILIMVAGGLISWNIYLHQSKRIEPASVEKMAFPLPDKPSIAVLPFNNLSDDTDQNFIADGISENIISALSKIDELFVIDKVTTLTFKGKAVNVKKVAEDLGVRYFLEGSVQKSDDTIRINTRLIDAVTGYHMWSEIFDREMKDFFQLLDDITHKVVVELQIKLTHGEQVRKWYGTTNFESWGYTVKGTSLFETYTKANNERAKELFNQSLAVDSKNAFALCMLSWTYVIDARLGFSKSPSESLEKATQIAQKAQAIDDSLPEVHALWNTIYLFQRQYDKAIAAGQKSIELGPNSAVSYILFAQTMCYAGNFEDAVYLAERSIRLSPYCPVWYSTWLARSYRHAGRYEDALDVFEEILDRAQKGEYYPSNALFHLGITYAMMGKYEEARIHLAKSINQNSNIVDYYRHHYSYFKNSDHFKNIFDSLRKAGIE
jgi:adenylate cyclase